MSKLFFVNISECSIEMMSGSGRTMLALFSLSKILKEMLKMSSFECQLSNIQVSEMVSS